MQHQDQNICEKFTIPLNFQGLRLDQAIAKLLPTYSRTTLQKWIRNGQILIDGQVINPNSKVQGGESIEVNAVLEKQVNWEPQPLSLDIRYEDETLLVVNKPPGLVVHPGAGNADKTLVNALLHNVPQTKHLPRAGIIHRLDKETSGLLLVAKTLSAHHALVQALQARDIHREYQAIVQGVLISGGTIDKPLARHPQHRLKRAVVENGKSAVTHYRIIKRYSYYTHVQVFLETGRTHQIRVHFAALGHPLVGDPLYGGRFKIPKQAPSLLKDALEQFKRQALHARKLVFHHPSTSQLLTIECEPPADYQALLAVLGAVDNSLG